MVEFMLKKKYTFILKVPQIALLQAAADPGITLMSSEVSALHPDTARFAPTEWEGSQRRQKNSRPSPALRCQAGLLTHRGLPEDSQ